MKSIILVIALALASSVASANHKWGVAGCGLGNQFFGAKDNQVLASTTNESTYTQLFGITSGTSNCVDHEGDTAKATKAFIEANQVALSTEMAKGQGETLASLSKILKCQDSAAFGADMQKHFGYVFPTANVDASQASVRVMKSVYIDSSLRSNCSI